MIRFARRGHEASGMTVQITRRDHEVVSMRDHASRVSEAAVARRLLALALVLEGHSRAHSAKTCGMDRQTLRDWVHRYNAQGIDGLSDRPHGGGAPPKLTDEGKTQLAAWVRQGPDIAEDGVVRWRLRDLRERILARFFVPMGRAQIRSDPEDVDAVIHDDTEAGHIIHNRYMSYAPQLGPPPRLPARCRRHRNRRLVRLIKAPLR
jgi:transposase